MKRSATPNGTFIPVTLGTLPDMTRAQLSDTWARVVGKPPIPGASHELLTAMTAAAATKDYAAVTTRANEFLEAVDAMEELY